MRIGFRWSDADSLTFRFGIPGNRARWSEIAARIAELLSAAVDREGVDHEAFQVINPVDELIDLHLKDIGR